MVSADQRGTVSSGKASPSGKSAMDKSETGKLGEADRDSEQTMGKSDKRIRPPGSKSVGWALVQAARLHRSRVGDRLAALDLFAGQEQVVQALAVAGTMTMGDLAATLRVRPPTASKTISRLAALGFVERRAEAGDGRVVRVRLTDTGLAKAEAIERIWDDVEAEMLDGFDGKEAASPAQALAQGCPQPRRRVRRHRPRGRRRLGYRTRRRRARCAGRADPGRPPRLNPLGFCSSVSESVTRHWGGNLCVPN